MIDEIAPEIVDMVVRAIRDPMIGGWPLIHWEWMFSTEWEAKLAPDGDGRGIAVIGAYPDSEDRAVTMSFDPALALPDLHIAGH